jgi:hypothetical protein
MYVWMAGRQAADCERDYMVRYTCAKMSYFLFGANCISSLCLAAAEEQIRLRPLILMSFMDRMPRFTRRRRSTEIT